MNILIAGGRDFNDYEFFLSSLADLMQRGIVSDDANEWCIISGMAKGADALGVRLANEHNLKLLEFPAQWKDMTPPCIPRTNQYGTYNALAGHNRNKQMGREADILIAFWDRKSKGTKDMIDFMDLLGKPVYIFNY